MAGEDPRNDGGGPERTDTFEILSNTRRVEIVEILDAEGTITVPRLAGKIAWRSAADPDTVHVELNHAHIPKMEDRGFVETEEEIVRTGPRFDALASRVG